MSRTTLLAATEVYWFVTATEYAPALVREKLVMTRLVPVAPGMGTPSNDHWQLNGPAEDTAMLKLVAPPKDSEIAGGGGIKTARAIARLW